jgi:hypothetical protein
MLPALRHVESWIFDLDNSLYPASANLFELIDQRMGAYIERLLGCDPPKRAGFRSSISTNMAPRWRG